MMVSEVSFSNYVNGWETVLILVLVDDGFWVNTWIAIGFGAIVLILVLVDDGFWDGSGGHTISFFYKVLILVLVDDGFWTTKYSTKVYQIRLS